jgi:hypothetical protein
MRVWQIAFDSQKHEKYALQAQNNLNIKEYYKKRFGVLI